MAAYQKTSALYDPALGWQSIGGSMALPRSIASDGRRWILALHVLIHLVALGFHVAAVVFMWSAFAQSQIKTAAITAVVYHGLAVLGLLALAAAEQKQIAFVFSLTLIIGGLVAGLSESIALYVLTFRSDDLLTEEHWLYSSSVYLQAIGLAFVIVCSLNMAANGDVAIDKKPETTPA